VIVNGEVDYICEGGIDTHDVGELSLRVAHNSTKSNNKLFREETEDSLSSKNPDKGYNLTTVTRIGERKCILRILISKIK